MFRREEVSITAGVPRCKCSNTINNAHSAGAQQHLHAVTAINHAPHPRNIGGFCELVGSAVLRARPQWPQKRSPLASEGAHFRTSGQGPQPNAAAHLWPIPLESHPPNFADILRF